MRIRPFRAILPILEKIETSEEFFESVREDFPNYYEKGFFTKTEQKAVFFYEIKTSFRKHYGVIASLELQDFYDGKIKKHENTLLEKERQQMALLIERGAMVKPVLLTYKAVPVLQSFMAEYAEKNEATSVYSFKNGEEVHRFWEINDTEKIEKLRTFFEQNIPFTYVADGHHRLTTNVLLHKSMKNEGDGQHYDQIYCAFFADEELSIASFNRVVNHDVVDFLEKIKNVAETASSENIIPIKKHDFSIFYQEKWHFFTWKKEIAANFETETGVILDVDLLNEKVLKSILEIEDVRKDTRIAYVEGVKGIAALEKSCREGNAKIAFSLFPVAIADLMSVSDQEGIMPPKSTWFEPRMKNGLMVQGIPME
jgi:uncharacterized protein (DUF1015 family)